MKRISAPEVSLKAGAAVVDITPPLDVGLLTSSVRGEWKPFKSVRTPLKARALVLEGSGQRVALVSVDLLGLTGRVVGGWRQFKRSIARCASGSFRPENIVLSCTHTHNAPETLGLTDLYRTDQFKRWLKQLAKKLSKVVAIAHASARECTLSSATTELNHFSLNRRIPMDGRIVMSDALQPIAPELFLRKPIDRRVRTLLFRDIDGSAIATMVHAVCHPVHEMCLPQISSDFPGELCRTLEERGDLGTVVFFNGTAADVNPPTVSEGAKEAARHGEALAAAVRSSLPNTQTEALPQLRFRNRTVRLPLRSKTGKPLARICSANLSALRLGDLAIVFMPGEIFSGTGLAIEERSPFQHTIVVGLTEGSIGYLPPALMFSEGGYEIGPGKWSFLHKSAESILMRETAHLLKDMR